MFFANHLVSKNAEYILLKSILTVIHKLMSIIFNVLFSY
jgi:hypothetical protein